MHAGQTPQAPIAAPRDALIARAGYECRYKEHRNRHSAQTHDVFPLLLPQSLLSLLHVRCLGLELCDELLSHRPVGRDAWILGHFSGLQAGG